MPITTSYRNSQQNLCCLFSFRTFFNDIVDSSHKENYCHYKNNGQVLQIRIASDLQGSTSGYRYKYLCK